MVDYGLHILIMIGIFAIIAVSYNLIMGYTGIISLAHAVFFGIGAYTSALLAVHWGAVFPIAMIVSILLTGIFGVLFILLMRRARGDYLSIATLGLQIVVFNVFLNWTDVTGGEGGVIGIPRPEFLGLKFSSVLNYALLTVILCAFCFVVAWWIAQSGFGRVLKAIREDELSTQSLGKNTFRYKVIIFAVSAGLAAVGGSLYAHYQQFINPFSFSVHDAIMILIIVVVGGAGNLWGSLLGAFVLITLPEALRFIPAASIFVAQIRVIIFSLALLLLIFFRPQGLLGEYSFGAVLTRKESAKLNERGISELQRQRVTSSREGETEKYWDLDKPILEVSNLSKGFGGIKAVDNISFVIMPGKVTGIIGPNGAGKTTLFNLICKYLTPDHGQVYFKGQNVTKLSPYKIARLGIGRSFQDLHIFGRMTVLDNILVALQDYRKDGNLLNIFIFARSAYQQDKRYREQGLQLLEGLGLIDKRDELAEELSYPEQKLLAIARSVATRAEVLIMDEVAAGLDPGSIQALSQLLRQLSENGKTVCLVEHNLDFVMSTVDTILFLDQGRLIAEGPPKQIVQDRKLAEIYFGGIR
jgi:branched-chain amino acid transport system permease protein